MKVLTVNCTNKTVVYFNSVFNLPSVIDIKGKKVAIFISKKVNEDVLHTLISSLEDGGANVFSYRTGDGEIIKTIEKVSLFSSFLSINGFNRDDIIVNIGGGTVCDSGAFAASIYMRGITYVNVPTTLLCAADACLGGKTAIDVGGVKNLWGTFWQPSAVIIDCNLIDKSENTFNNGISEIVKYGVIDKNFGEKLKAIASIDQIKSNLEQVIYDCLKIKGELVEIDEFDRAQRRFLNLGHTVAHAIESASGYQTGHAQAVAIGIYAESLISLKAGLLCESKYSEIISMLNLFIKDYAKIPNLLPLISYMKGDKKNLSGKIAFSLPCNDGVNVVYFTQKQLEDLFK
ncbi:MAG: 3-dehydroquinate synthase [Clostridia bacterium]|nr:3-dehydroquinate synthase [Clostridia bacterium]